MQTPSSRASRREDLLRCERAQDRASATAKKVCISKHVKNNAHRRGKAEAGRESDLRKAEYETTQKTPTAVALGAGCGRSAIHRAPPSSTSLVEHVKYTFVLPPPQGGRNATGLELGAAFPALRSCGQLWSRRIRLRHRTLERTMQEECGATILTTKRHA